MKKAARSPIVRDTSPAAAALAEWIAKLQERTLDDALGHCGHPRLSEASWVCRCGARRGFARRGTRPRLLRTASGPVPIKLYQVRCSACGAVFSPFSQIAKLESERDRSDQILERLRTLPPSTTDLGDSKPPPAHHTADKAIAFARWLRPFCLIDRHLLQDMAASFVLGLGTFTFVLLMNQMVRLMDLIINKGVGLGVVLRLFIYILPFSLTVTIPMSVLLAVLATYGRLSSEGEAIALKTGGLSLYRLMAPGLLVGIVATLVTLWITVSIQPSSTRAFTTLMHRLYQTKAILALQEGVFNTDYPGLTVYVDHLEEQSALLAGILIIDRRNPADQRVVIAREGRMLDVKDGEGSRTGIQLSQGNIHMTSRNNPGRYRNLKFQTYDLQIAAGSRFAETLERPKQGREMRLGELQAEIQRLKKNGGRPLDLQVEWHKKFALPIACLILSLIGAPLGMRIKKASRGISLALSVAFAVFYYVLLAAGESLGSRGRIEPALGIWSPNFILGIIGIGLVLAEGREALLPARLRSAVSDLPAFLSRGASQHKTS